MNAAVNPETLAYLRMADRNRDLARVLLDSTSTMPSPDWATVVAFYAAVHYVHAFLYEQSQGYVPTDHRERGQAVAKTTGLIAAQPSYDNLYGLSRLVRYKPRYRVKASVAQDALADLYTVEQIVWRGLGT